MPFSYMGIFNTRQVERRVDVGGDIDRDFFQGIAQRMAGRENAVLIMFGVMKLAQRSF